MPPAPSPPSRRAPTAPSPWSWRALAALFLTTGVLHFAVPDPYVRIIPRLLPGGWARPLVYASGAAELAGGLALLPSRTRRGAAWFLVALLVAVFPANVQMAVDSPNVLTIARLPVQFPLVWWALHIARRPGRTGAGGPPTADHGGSLASGRNPAGVGTGRARRRDS
jgi:uncharacterized membrane protein